MVAGGLLDVDEDGCRSVTASVDALHAVKTFGFAAAMLDAAKNIRMPNTGERAEVWWLFSPADTYVDRSCFWCSG